MTLAVLGRVSAGFILATDRIEVSPDPFRPDLSGEPSITRILLSRKRPLGVLFWGGGGLGASTFSEISGRFEDWAEKEGSPLRKIADDLARFLAQRALPSFSSLRPYLLPRTGFFLAGFETEGEAVARDWVWEMAEPFSPPRPGRAERPEEPRYGFNWRGDQEVWMTRLILGYDPALLGLLESHLSTSQERLVPLFRRVELPISYSSMDLEQAMNMAAYMINATLGLLHLLTFHRQWRWEIEMAIITPEEARRVMPQESQET
ncbi:MAG: hypothetical protein QHH30_03965 [candidate division NC10 bacterium]|nr:hypothetical protein [candidate division NC10 bacterium]